MRYLSILHLRPTNGNPGWSTKLVSSTPYITSNFHFVVDLILHDYKAKMACKDDLYKPTILLELKLDGMASKELVVLLM